VGNCGIVLYLSCAYEYIGDNGDEPLIKKLLSPDTGVGVFMSLVVLGEIVFVAVGVAVFFKLKEA